MITIVLIVLVVLVIVLLVGYGIYRIANSLMISQFIRDLLDYRMD